MDKLTFNDNKYENINKVLEDGKVNGMFDILLKDMYEQLGEWL